jgi:DNA-binding Lrp family transcriptional regulator
VSELDDDLALADAWQRGFPLVETPFAEVASRHDISEAQVLASFEALAANRQLGRIGAVVRHNCAGASTLAAISVPPHRVEQTAAIVSQEPLVNHNYERDHAINLWFVVAAPDRAQLVQTLRRIERRTGCRVLDLRLIEPYHIDLGFGLVPGQTRQLNNRNATRPASARERELLAAIEDGLPLVARPYAAIAGRLGWMEADVIACLSSMIADGIVSRFGCVLRHREIGFAANAMAVWDIADVRAGDFGRRIATHAEVTLCYRRKRARPVWRYNLFAMIHGREEASVRRIVAGIATASGLAGAPHEILFSRRCFVQRGARFHAERQAAA